VTRGGGGCWDLLFLLRYRDSGGWELLFLQWDFFLLWDRDREALRDWDLLFLQWERGGGASGTTAVMGCDQ
jgi:hypothetical protein